MKLIIDIDEEDFEIMKHNIAVDNPLCPINQKEMVTKIANGIPINNLKEIYIGMDSNAVQIYPNNDVLEKIRAEIEEQKNDRCFDDDDMYIYMTGLNDAIDIIDKYRNEVINTDAGV